MTSILDASTLESAEHDTGALSAEALDTMASLYALLATAFRYPDPSECEALGNEALWERTRSAAADLDANVCRSIVMMERCLRTASGRRDGGVQAILADAHARLFSHAVRGACPPYELEYGRRDIVQQSPELADIGGFYAAFGLEMTPAAHERLDHVSVECEFMSWLARKESVARGQGNEESAETSRDARRAFLSDHLGRWGPVFARRVEEADLEGFHGAAGAALAGLLSWDASRLGVSLGPSFLQLAPAEDDPSTSFECGLDDAGPAGERLVTLGVDRAPRTMNHVHAVDTD